MSEFIASSPCNFRNSTARSARRAASFPSSATLTTWTSPPLAEPRRLEGGQGPRRLEAAVVGDDHRLAVSRLVGHGDDQPGALGQDLAQGHVGLLPMPELEVGVVAQEDQVVACASMRIWTYGVPTSSSGLNATPASAQRQAQEDPSTPRRVSVRRAALRPRK